MTTAGARKPIVLRLACAAAAALAAAVRVAKAWSIYSYTLVLNLLAAIPDNQAER